MKKIKVTISKDRLQAFMSVSDYTDLKLSDIVKTLQEAGLTYGIQGENIKTAFNHKILNTDILVAYGKPPVQGVDAKIECLVDITPQTLAEIIDDKNDYVPVTISNVKKGQKLFKVEPHTAGVAGISINGSEIFAKPGRPARPIKGRNVRFSPYNPNYLVSEVDGNLVWDELRANVMPDYKAFGSLGVLNGDIYFIGNLIVTGNINPGIKVKTGGNLEVWGNVEDSTLEAEGDIVIRGGFFGHGKGKLFAKGNITVSLVDNQLVHSLRTITIKKECVNANLNAYTIQAESASIFGGTITAFDSIEVRELGRSQNVITKVSIGSKLHKMNMIRILENEIREIETYSKKLNESANYLLAKRMKFGFITPDEELDYLTTKDELKEMVMKLKSLMERREFYISKLNDRINPRLRILDSIYPNVLLSINDIRSENSRVFSNSVFFERDNSVFRAALPKFETL